jgi:hypothetical protein
MPRNAEIGLFTNPSNLAPEPRRRTLWLVGQDASLASFLTTLCRKKKAGPAKSDGINLEVNTREGLQVHVKLLIQACCFSHAPLRMIIGIAETRPARDTDTKTEPVKKPAHTVGSNQNKVTVVYRRLLDF